MVKNCHNWWSKIVQMVKIGGQKLSKLVVHKKITKRLNYLCSSKVFPPPRRFGTLTWKFVSTLYFQTASLYRTILGLADWLYIFQEIKWWYRVTSHTWPCISGNLKKVTCPVYAYTIAYIEGVTFHKVQDIYTAMFIRVVVNGLHSIRALASTERLFAIRRCIHYFVRHSPLSEKKKSI